MLSLDDVRRLNRLLTTEDYDDDDLATAAGLDRRSVAVYRAEFDRLMIWAAAQLGADRPAFKIFAG